MAALRELRVPVHQYSMIQELRRPSHQSECIVRPAMEQKAPSHRQFEKKCCRGCFLPHIARTAGAIHSRASSSARPHSVIFRCPRDFNTQGSSYYNYKGVVIFRCPRAYALEVPARHGRRLCKVARTRAPPFRTDEVGGAKRRRARKRRCGSFALALATIYAVRL